jgi:hypothetical protein
LDAPKPKKADRERNRNKGYQDPKYCFHSPVPPF